MISLTKARFCTVFFVTWETSPSIEKHSVLLKNVWPFKCLREKKVKKEINTKKLAWNVSNQNFICFLENISSLLFFHRKWNDLFCLSLKELKFSHECHWLKKQPINNNKRKENKDYFVNWHVDFLFTFIYFQELLIFLTSKKVKKFSFDMSYNKIPHRNQFNSKIGSIDLY